MSIGSTCNISVRYGYCGNTILAVWCLAGCGLELPFSGIEAAQDVSGIGVAKITRAESCLKTHN